MAEKRGFDKHQEGDREFPKETGIPEASAEVEVTATANHGIAGGEFWINTSIYTDSCVDRLALRLCPDFPEGKCLMLGTLLSLGAWVAKNADENKQIPDTAETARDMCESIRWDRSPEELLAAMIEEEMIRRENGMLTITIDWLYWD